MQRRQFLKAVPLALLAQACGRISNPTQADSIPVPVPPQAIMGNPVAVRSNLLGEHLASLTCNRSAALQDILSEAGLKPQLQGGLICGLGGLTPTEGFIFVINNAFYEAPIYNFPNRAADTIDIYKGVLV